MQTSSSETMSLRRKPNGGSVATRRAQPFASALSRKIGTGPPMKYGPCILRTDSTPISVRYTSIPSPTDLIAFAPLRPARISLSKRAIISYGHHRHEWERSMREPDRAGFIHGSPRAAWTDNSLSCVWCPPPPLRPTRAVLVLPRAFFRRETSRTSRPTCNGVEINIADERTPLPVSEIRRRISREEVQLYASMDRELQKGALDTRGTWHRRFILSIDSKRDSTWDSSPKNKT